MEHKTIQMRKWYRQMRGFGGSASIEVAAFKETGRMTSEGVFSLFSGKDGAMREHSVTPIYKAIDKNGIICEIEANELQSNGAIGIGSLAERFDIPDLTDEELEQLKVKGTKKVAREKAEAEEAKRKREELRQQLLKDYSYLPNKCADGYVSVAKVAENVRANLKAVFGAQKFSVRSSRFSGGDDIHVEWVNGPTLKMTKKETSKYEDSSNDITGDYRDYTPSAFNDVFGGTKYMWTNRKMQSGFEALVREFCGVSIEEPFKYDRQCGEDKRWHQYHAVMNAWNETAFPAGAVITGIYKLSQEEIEKINDRRCGDLVIYGFKYDAPTTKTPTEPHKNNAPEKVDVVTVTINEEKHGVEIRFPFIPSAEVREKMKQAGWRWSKFNKAWYNKDTAENREFAYALAA